VTTGKVSEQLLPFLAEFPFNPRDARFLGPRWTIASTARGRPGAAVVLVEVKTKRWFYEPRAAGWDAVRAGRVEGVAALIPEGDGALRMWLMSRLKSGSARTAHRS
jgi:predicted Holliday junction resolvase-like endonuclease